MISCGKKGAENIIQLLRVKSSEVDSFWCLKFLKDSIDLPNMIGLFPSGSTNTLVAKIGTKNLAISCSVNRNNGWILTLRVSK